MKFTKEEAYKDLVGKLTEKGEALNLTERTANRLLETLMKRLVTDETELSEFVSETFIDFKELDGQIRKDKSDFIKRWNDEHPNPAQPTPPVAPNGETKTELEKRLEAMELEFQKAKKVEKINSIKSILLATMKSKGITDEEWAKDFISEVSITEDFDVESKAESYLKIFNKSHAGVPTNVTPHGSSSTSNDSVKFDDVVALRNKKYKTE